MRFEKFCIFVALTVLLLFILGQRAYAQTSFKRSYEINITNLPLLDLTLVYTQKFKENLYFEITNSFVYHKSKEHDNAKYFFRNTQDPYKLYDLYKFRIGLRHFHSDRFYTCPTFIFNIGGFRDITIMHYYDIKGSDAYDEDYRLSRLRSDFGLIYKCGFFNIDENRVITDVYFGIGFKAKLYYDTIFQKWQHHRLYFDGPPMIESYVKFMPTFHFGIMLGFRK